MRVFIDDTDIADLGMFIEKGGDYDLLSFPTRKKPVQQDWFEHDGLDCDLSEVLFEAKKVKVKYILVADNSTEFLQRLNTVKTIHNQAGYRKLKIEAFNRTFSLRTLNFSEYRQKGGLVKAGKKIANIHVEYSMDDPLQYFVAYHQTPNLSRENLAHVTLLQPASPKQGLVFKSKYSTGLIADTDFQPKQKSRKLVLECTMLTDTYEEFEHNYTALFRQLTKSGEIEISTVDGAIPCFYNKMSNFKKKKPLHRGAFIDFNLEFTTI